MSDDVFDEIDDEPELDDVTDDNLELDDDLPLDDTAVDAPDDEDDEGENVAGDRTPPAEKKRSRRSSEEDEDVLELEEEHHPDDVEDPLDVLLHERTASASLEDEDEEVVEEIDVDERGEGATRIVPRRPGEFLCASCFLVLPRSQLADEQRMLCRDCA